VNNLRSIAITHKNFPLDIIGQFHIQQESRAAQLHALKAALGLEELMYISTCNRVEFIFTLPHYVCPGFTAQFLACIKPEWNQEMCKEIASKCERYNEAEAIDHLLRVACSLDSVILGEREIITQLRKSFEECVAAELCSENIRLVIKQCIKSSKEVFTNTDLSKKPVSAVSLAWQEFLKCGFKSDARVLMIGAGQVIRNFGKFLFENNYTNITIANRTIAKAQELADAYSGTALSLAQLANYDKGFDAIITCTAAETWVVDTTLYAQLLKDEKQRKLVIDLALPADIEGQVLKQFEVHYVGMNQIQALASENIAYRQLALQECEAIIENGKKEFEKSMQQRQIEIAMQAIPAAVKDIRNTALGSVFAKDLEQLDEQSREVIEKIMSYMEKKYISIPMKMAREVLMNEVIKN
jgi:glutamyl-tRNA reductase